MFLHSKTVFFLFVPNSLAGLLYKISKALLRKRRDHKFPRGIVFFFCPDKKHAWYRQNPFSIHSFDFHSPHDSHGWLALDKFRCPWDTGWILDLRILFLDWHTISTPRTTVPSPSNQLEDQKRRISPFSFFLPFHSLSDSISVMGYGGGKRRENGLKKRERSFPRWIASKSSHFPRPQGFGCAQSNSESETPKKERVFLYPRKDFFQFLPYSTSFPSDSIGSLLRNIGPKKS